MLPEHERCLVGILKKQRLDLQFFGLDGGGVLGHSSLVCLTSPMLAQVLADQGGLEQLITVYLPVAYSAIRAFNRICEAGGVSCEEDSEAASEVFSILKEFSRPAKILESHTTDIWDSIKTDTALEQSEIDNQIHHIFIENETKISPNLSNKEKLDKGDCGDGDGKKDSISHSVGDSHVATQFESKSPKKVKGARIKCKQCPKTFSYIAVLKKHLPKHKEDGGRSNAVDSDVEGDLIVNEYPCEMCCEKTDRHVFKLKSSRIRHQMKVHNRSHECCGGSYSDYKVYKKHILNGHHSFQCAECVRTFHRKEQLNSHIKWNHEAEPQKCPLCPAVIKNVEYHLKHSHTGELMTCSACSYSSRRKGDLDIHYIKVHTVLNLETCPLCGGTFKALKRHLARTKCGTGKKAEAVIACPKGCPKMFADRSSVNKHVKQVHLQIKNNICSFCDYKTFLSFNLKLHMTKMHEGKNMEKLQCLHCDKSTFSLEFHMQRYHPEI